jgi:hypothetical protein
MFVLSRKCVFAAFISVCLLLPAGTLGQVGTISQAEKIKATASTYHASGKATVSVGLKDGRSYKGRITRIEDDHFILLDPDANREVQIQYDSVSKLRKRGMSKAAKTAIWVGVAAGVGALIVFGRPGRTIGPICPLGCGL